MSNKKEKTIPNEEKRTNMGSGDKIPMKPSFYKNPGFTITEVNRFEANEKNLCSSLFLIKLQALRLTASLKRDSKTGFFPVNIAKFLRAVFP